MTTNCYRTLPRRPRELLLLAAPVLVIPVLACNAAPPIGETELAASAGFRARVKKGALFIDGGNESSRLALRLATSQILDVDVGDDGVADFSFDRSTFDRIIIDAGGGDDVVRMDETRGAFTLEEQVTISGGAGNDTLLGGAGVEVFFAGPGDDLIDGRLGNDFVSMGDGDDTFLWNPGDGSDVVEGDGGTDLMAFNGSNAAERIVLAADGGRLRFTRDVGAVTMDVDRVERVSFAARGGADTVDVNDLSGTAVRRIDVALEAVAGSGQGDGQPDVVNVLGAGTIDVAADGAAVVTTGLATVVGVTGGEVAIDRLVVLGGDRLNVNGSAVADTMTVLPSGDQALVAVDGFNVLVQAGGAGTLALHGLGGDDTITALNGLPPALRLELDGGDGNDTLRGGDLPELLLGGPGDDVIDGGLGADVALLGDGDDTFVWNPGGGSDVVEGEAGADTLRFFGSNIDERMELSANGDRLRLTRNVATVTMDVDGVERAELFARGGSDELVVNDLGGTAVTRVNANLEAVPGAGQDDLMPDLVTVNGAGTIDVAVDGGAVVASGLAAEVAVTGGEPGSDRLVVNGADILNVNGSSGDDIMTVATSGSNAGVLVAGFNVFVEQGGAAKLAVNGLGGADTITVQNGLPQISLQLDGGEGNDTLQGGNLAEVLLGGPGDDTISGGLGADSVFLGEGDDVFIWNPGDGSDLVEGEDGVDTLRFFGSNVAEQLELVASGDRLRMFRDIGAVSMDVGGVERADLAARSGADRVVVNDLAGTAITQVNVDLAAIPGDAAGDAFADVVTVNGSAADDVIAITADPGAAVVSGLAATVRVAHPDAALDQLVVNGLGGVDTITAGPGVVGLILLGINQD